MNLSTVLLAAPGFNTDPTTIPGMAKVNVVIGWAAWIATALCIIALIIAGAKMALSTSHGNDDGGFEGVGKVIAGSIIVGAAAQLVNGITGFNLFTSTPQAIPGLTTVQTVIGYVMWGAVAACVVGAIVVGTKIATSHRQGRDDGMQKFGGLLGGCLVVASAGTVIGAILS